MLSIIKMKRKYPLQKWMPQVDYVSIKDTATLLADRVAFLFTLIPLVEKGKQCDYEHTDCDH